MTNTSKLLDAAEACRDRAVLHLRHDTEERLLDAAAMLRAAHTFEEEYRLIERAKAKQEAKG